MFELVAVGHQGLTYDVIAAMPIGEVRQPLTEWLDHGARAPMRLATNGDADALRRLQESLSFHGVRTQIRKSARDISAAFATATPSPPPPIVDEGARRDPPPVSRDSGLIEYRQMMKEMDERRTSTSHVIAVTSRSLRPTLFAVAVAIALLGILISMATRS